MHLWKGDNKFGQGPPSPPLIRTKSKRKGVFSQENVPLEVNICLLYAYLPSCSDVNNVYYKETQAVKRKGINEIEEKVYSSWRFFVFHLSLFQDSSTAVDATNIENVCYFKTKIIEGDEVTYC